MYSEVFELQADFLKALSHSKRLEIIRLLRDQELCVSDIYEMLDLPQANISQHLMVLRDAGVVTSKRQGKQILYSLSDQKIISACDLLRDVLLEKYPSKEELSLRMKDMLPITHDPVCKMRLSPKTASYSASHNGHQFYFCASGCLKKFNKRPASYV